MHHRQFASWILACKYKQYITQTVHPQWHRQADNITTFGFWLVLLEIQPVKTHNTHYTTHLHEGAGRKQMHISGVQCFDDFTSSISNAVHMESGVLQREIEYSIFLCGTTHTHTHSTTRFDNTCNTHCTHTYTCHHRTTYITQCNSAGGSILLCCKSFHTCWCRWFHCDRFAVIHSLTTQEACLLSPLCVLTPVWKHKHTAQQ